MNENEHEVQVGYNMPPLHPNCRSTIVPDDEDMDRADERDIEEVRRLLGKEADEGYNEGEVTRMTMAGHASTPKQATPNSVIDKKSNDGKVVDRSFYNALGMKYKAIHTTDHGNRKLFIQQIMEIESNIHMVNMENMLMNLHGLIMVILIVLIIGN